MQLPVAVSSKSTLNKRGQPTICSHGKRSALTPCRHQIRPCDASKHCKPAASQPRPPPLPIVSVCTHLIFRTFVHTSKIMPPPYRTNPYTYRTPTAIPQHPTHASLFIVSTNSTDVSAPSSVSTATTALLCRWEEVLLADTLRFSLDTAVARAKRVLHLGDLEGELREEGREGGW